jgi:acylphosphatase
MEDVYHESIHFSGRVQGVGFRYKTQQVAMEFEVSGWVRNLADGRVQLEVEGAEDEVKRFVDELVDRMNGFIRKTERRSEWRGGQFRGFEIVP